MANRGWRPAEARLVSEFIAARWPGREFKLRCRVGSHVVPEAVGEVTDAERRALGIWRRWVDAVVIDKARVLLVEGKIKPDPGVVSQLDLYMRLWPATPEYTHLAGRPAVGVIVLAIDDPIIRDLAVARGYTVFLFRPPWVLSYLETLYPRTRDAGRR